VLVGKLQGMMTEQVPPILDAIFECTLDMINKDFSEYPEHRVEFFKLLRVINQRCFPALLKLDQAHFKLVIDSCMWASKHDNRAVEGEGLNMCIELISNMADQTDQSTCDAFFRSFYTTILQDVFFVLTDSDHKAGFKYQSLLLARMFWLVGAEKIQSPIYDESQAPAGSVSNKDFLSTFVASLLSNAFPNLSAPQITGFIRNLFESTDDIVKFKLILRDFLIQLKEFAGDNAELFTEDRELAAKEQKEKERERGMKVGGLLKPSEIEDDEL
ncbi:Exportin-1, partial [Hortaea werneckii]